ncbi:hypothetical protein CPB83DRAFT_853101 [Crepidotus variabilis]|uniref:Uncharacterized protein n=1 Tax=Crepidotus variabilis TaxID=179855 RepID=A0A9P6EHG3_9AGAR|nr:hypothetical protein CPB83DRAFT_853101 [Crepidotus variabilis]
MTTRPLTDGESRPEKRQCLAVRAADGFQVENVTPRRGRAPTKVISEFSGNINTPAHPESRGSSKKLKAVGRLKPPSVHSSSRAGAENKPPAVEDSENHKRPPGRIHSGLSFLQTTRKEKPVGRVLAAPNPPQLQKRPQTPLVAVVPPRPLLASASKVQKAVKPVQPPTFETPKKSTEPQDLLTISTTKLGRLNHLSSENGGEELAAMLLRESVPVIHKPSDGTDNSQIRGLEMSPEKKFKGDTQKLVRGGLAAQARRHFDQSHTNLVLWRKEVDHRVSSVPEIIVRIERLLVNPQQLSSSKVSSAVALCRITQQRSTDRLSFKRDELYRIVFPFPQGSLPPKTFDTGRLIHIYRPWQEINNQPQEQSLLPRLPASLPLPKSLSSTPESLPTNPTTLLCSRFLLI